MGNCIVGMYRNASYTFKWRKLSIRLQISCCIQKCWHFPFCKIIIKRHLLSVLLVTTDEQKYTYYRLCKSMILIIYVVSRTKLRHDFIDNLVQGVIIKYVFHHDWLLDIKVREFKFNIPNIKKRMLNVKTNIDCWILKSNVKKYC